MNNDELAMLIKQGNFEYLPQLWKNTEFLLYNILRKKIYNYPLPNYITVDDLKQHMFFALCNAVKAYEPEKPYQFNTYLSYQVMAELQNAIPKNSREIQELSYNQTTADEETTELIDFIEDTTAYQELESVETTEVSKTLYDALSKLTPLEQAVITKHFLLRMSYDKIATSSGITKSKTMNAKNNGICKLRKNKELQNIYLQSE